MKNEQLIKELILKGEDTQLELCETVRKEAIAKTISSFLNGEGGQLIIGVKDNGTITGVQNAFQVEQDLKQYLLKNIIPESPVTFSIEKINKKEIVMIKVWGGSKKPYIFSGSIFYRRGSRTVQATSKEISELIHNRQLSETHWERQPVLGADLFDLDEYEIRNTIKQLQESGRGKAMSDNIKEFLSYYGLYENGYLTNAAIVLFGKEPTRFIPQCRVRFAILKGGKTGASFSQDQYLEDNLFKNAEAIYDLLKKHISFSSNFDKTLWQRTDGFLYPMSALREGVMNALVHRDYSNPAGTISILIYPDRLEISNYGKLPPEIKLADLRRNHLSLPNNPYIAHVCFLKGYIERIGRGTLKIIEACKSAGMKAPVWSAESNAIKLTFFSKIKMPVAKVVVTKKITEGINKSIIAKVEDVTEGITEGVTNDVSTRIRDILLYILKNQKTKVSDLMAQFNVSERTIKSNLKILSEAKLIEYKGSKIAGTYTLTKKLHNKLQE